ncbi:MAG: amidohydrolase [Planctomycetia bacterium]|nr:amidohydrolase [Planctomycetia bacterium]
MIRSACPRRDVLKHTLGAVSAATLANQSRSADAPVAPIIDTHVHFYDPTRPEGVPWPAKTDDVLYRRVLPDEWERLVAPLGPAGAIVVEASPWVEDNQWLLDLAERHTARLPEMPGVVGVVGNLPLEDASAATLIDRFAKHRLFRGIRVNGDKLLAGLDDAGYRSHVARLVDHGLALDINGGRTFAAAAAVAARFPPLRIVLDHMGNTRISRDGPLPEWCAAVERVARLPNVFMKASGLVESAAHSMKPAQAPRDPAFYEPWLAAVWKAFGYERVMYGSNWPVSDRAADYATVHAIVAAFAQSRGTEAERWFFTDTSRAAYRWA